MRRLWLEVEAVTRATKREHLGERATFCVEDGIMSPWLQSSPTSQPTCVLACDIVL